MLRLGFCALALFATVSCSTSLPPPPPLPPAPVVAAHPAANDYSQDAAWLCRPGRADACAADEDATIISPSGALKLEKFAANPNAPIDCFYVYPTWSLDPTPNSDMKPGPEEKEIVATQFARFGSVCRTFAPLYRQITIAALRASMGGAAMKADGELAYDDVRDAWRYYLEHDNQGRGFVLIGHSQGAGVLSRLIAEEIDGKPAQVKLVSALLLGATVALPKGADVGGTFKNVPACRKLGQIGCVIAYSSFPSDAPPPPNSRFGRVWDAKANAPNPAMTALCANPAALAGGEGVAKSYFTTQPDPYLPPSGPKEWVAGAKIGAPFVATPGLVRTRCVSDANGFTYLSVRVLANPKDVRAHTIPGSLGPNFADWGLHAVDVHLTIGNLIDDVKAQTRTYLAQP